MAVAFINNEFLSDKSSKAFSPPIREGLFEQHVEQYKHNTASSKKTTHNEAKTNSNSDQHSKVNNNINDGYTPTDTSPLEDNNDTSLELGHENHSTSAIIPNELLEISYTFDNIATLEPLDTNIEPQIFSDPEIEEVQISTTSENNDQLPTQALNQVVMDDKNIAQTSAGKATYNIPETTKPLLLVEDESEDEIQSEEISHVSENIIIPATILPANFSTEINEAPEMVTTSVETEEGDMRDVSLPSARDITQQEKSLEHKGDLQNDPQSQTQMNKPLEDAKVDVSLAEQSQQVPLDITKPEIATTASSSTSSAVNERMNQQSKERRAPPSQPEEFLSIIESVNVQPVGNSNNIDKEMLPDFNQKKESILESDIIKTPIFNDDLESIKHGTSSINTIDNKEVSPTIELSQTEDIESVSHQLKTAVQNISNVNGKKITINLTPASLGRVEIEVTTEAGKITAIKIEAAKPETLVLLEKNSQMVQDALKTVLGNDDASLSFNLKHGNHSKDEQPTSAKNQQVDNLLIDEETQNSSPSNTRAIPDNVYGMDSSSGAVDLRF